MQHVFIVTKLLTRSWTALAVCRVPPNDGELPDPKFCQTAHVGCQGVRHPDASICLLVIGVRGVVDPNRHHHQVNAPPAPRLRVGRFPRIKSGVTWPALPPVPWFFMEPAKDAM